MEEAQSPWLRVSIAGADVPPRALVRIKEASGRGLSEVRARIASGTAVLEVEMFTNDWYDTGARNLLELLAALHAHRVTFTLHEAQGADALRITWDALRHTVDAGREEVACLQARAATRMAPPTPT